MLETDLRSGFGQQYRLSPEGMLRSFEWLKMHAGNAVEVDEGACRTIGSGG